MHFGTNKPDVVRVRAALSRAVLEGIQRTDDGGAWSKGLLGVEGATPANIRAFVRWLVQSELATARKVKAGRTPIGGGWSAHTKVELTEHGRLVLAEELAAFGANASS